MFSGSVEQSPRMSHFQFENSDTFGLGSGETQLREDLADAMKESPGGALIDAGKLTVFYLLFFCLFDFFMLHALFFLLICKRGLITLKFTLSNSSLQF